MISKNYKKNKPAANPNIEKFYTEIHKTTKQMKISKLQMTCAYRNNKLKRQKKAKKQIQADI